MSSPLLTSRTFLWGQKRPDKTKEEIDRALSRRDAGVLVPELPWESRHAIRTLLYAVIEEDHWRDALDGISLPPPFVLPELRKEVSWSPSFLQSIVDSLSPELDVYIVLIPLTLGCRMGQYDARLRVGARRLCAMLAVPFTVVSREEQFLVSEALHGRNRQCGSSTEGSTSTLYRALKVGGFAALGGAALTLTGGLAAPLVAPAYSAVVAGVSTSVGAVGAVGTAVLGGTTAVASGFAAAMGTVTHSAALGGLLLPALTAGNVTALFGATGAGLAGYKAYHRTSETSDFRFRRVADEKPAFMLHSSAAAKAPGVSAYADQRRALADSWILPLPSFIWTEDQGEPPLPGLVVPAHLRHITLGNVAALPQIRTRFRKLVFCIQSQLTAVDLHLKAFCMVSGTWAVGPPLTIPSTCCGVFSSVNRVGCPTGTGFMVCYQGFPSSSSAGSSTYSPFRFWLRVVLDSFGYSRFSFYAEPTKLTFDVDAATAHLGAVSVPPGETVYGPMGIQMFVEESTELLTLTVSSTLSGNTCKVPNEKKVKRSLFRLEEVPYWRKQYASEANGYRRCLHVSVANRSLCAVEHMQTYVLCGTSLTSSSVGSVLECGSAMLHTYVNDSWSLKGIDVIHIFRVNRNTGGHTDEESGDDIFIRVHLALTVLNSLQLAVDEGNCITLLKKRRAPALKAPPEGEWEQILSQTTSVVLDLRVVEENGSRGLELKIKDGVAASSTPMDQPGVTIAVSGYSGIFDPRRPMEDQQLALWEPVLRQVHHFKHTEHYVLHWEQSYQTRFAESINASVLSPALNTATGIAVSVARKAVLHGSLFTGFFAYQALVGTLMLPLSALSATDVIDNAYATLTNRAISAGKELATALMTVNATASRPTTLVGFSFGASVICHCLQELHERQAFGIIENVFLLGCPCNGEIGEWSRLREVVAGRFVNVYHSGDWLLWLMQRSNLSWARLAGGLQPIHVPGVENVDMGLLAPQHAQLAVKLTDILSSIEEYPTEAIWDLRQNHGSAGVVTTCRETSAEVAMSMRKACESFSQEKVTQVFRVCNSLVVDPESTGEAVTATGGLLTVRNVAVHRCYYAFEAPVAGIRSGEFGIFSVVGETKGEIAGCFSLELRIHECTGTETVCGHVVVYFVGNNKVMKVGVDIKGRSTSSTECNDRHDNSRSAGYSVNENGTPVQMDDVVPTVATIKKHATHCCSLGLHTKGLYHHAEFPLHGWFEEGKEIAVIHFSCDITESSLDMDICGLLSKKSTLLERQTFQRHGFGYSPPLYHHHQSPTPTPKGSLPSGLARVERLELLQTRLEQGALRHHGQLHPPPSPRHSSHAVDDYIPPLVLLNSSCVTMHLDINVRRECFFNFPPAQLDPSSFSIVYLKGGAVMAGHDDHSGNHSDGNAERRTVPRKLGDTLLRYVEEGQPSQGFRIFISEDSHDIQWEPLEKEEVNSASTVSKVVVREQPYLLFIFSSNGYPHTPNENNSESEQRTYKWRIL